MTQCSYGSAGSEVADKAGNLLDRSGLAPSSYANSRNVSRGLVVPSKPVLCIYGASRTYMYHAAIDIKNCFILLLFHEKESPLVDTGA